MAVVQTSPVGLVAFALIVSGPAPSVSRRSTLNEPLGARRRVVSTTVPLRLSSTSQRRRDVLIDLELGLQAAAVALDLELARESPVHSPATRISLRLRCLLELLSSLAAARRLSSDAGLAAAIVAGGVVGAVLGERRGGRERRGGEH